MFFFPNKAFVTECSSFKKKDSCHFNVKIYQNLILMSKHFSYALFLHIGYSSNAGLVCVGKDGSVPRDKASIT